VDVKVRYRRVECLRAFPTPFLYVVRPQPASFLRNVLTEDLAILAEVGAETGISTKDTDNPEIAF